MFCAVTGLAGRVYYRILHVPDARVVAPHHLAVVGRRGNCAVYAPVEPYYATLAGERHFHPDDGLALGVPRIHIIVELGASLVHERELRSVAGAGISEAGQIVFADADEESIIGYDRVFGYTVQRQIYPVCIIAHVEANVYFDISRLGIGVLAGVVELVRAFWQGGELGGYVIDRSYWAVRRIQYIHIIVLDLAAAAEDGHRCDGDFVRRDSAHDPRISRNLERNGPIVELFIAALDHAGLYEALVCRANVVRLEHVGVFRLDARRIARRIVLAKAEFVDRAVERHAACVAGSAADGERTVAACRRRHDRSVRLGLQNAVDPALEALLCEDEIKVHPLVGRQAAQVLAEILRFIAGEHGNRRNIVVLPETGGVSVGIVQRCATAEQEGLVDVETVDIEPERRDEAAVRERIDAICRRRGYEWASRIGAAAERRADKTGNCAGV